MRGEVVLPRDPLDAEPAVLLWRKLPLLRDGERRDGECPLDRAHIHALNARRRRVKVERDGERRKCGVGTLAIGILFGLSSNEPLLSIAFR